MPVPGRRPRLDRPIGKSDGSPGRDASLSRNDDHAAAVRANSLLSVLALHRNFSKKLVWEDGFEPPTPRFQGENSLPD